MVVSASDAADIYGGRWFDICSAHLRSGCSQYTVHMMQRQACAAVRLRVYSSACQCTVAQVLHRVPWWKVQEQ